MRTLLALMALATVMGCGPSKYPSENPRQPPAITEKAKAAAGNEQGGAVTPEPEPLPQAPAEPPAGGEG